MKDQSPNFFDKAFASVLSTRTPVLLVVAAVCFGSMIYSLREQCPFTQNWLIEIFGATLLFLAVLGIDPGRVSYRLLATIGVFGAVLALASFLTRGNPSISAILTEASAAFILFVLLEVLLRRILNSAAAREASLLKRIHDARIEVINKAIALQATLIPEYDMEAYEEYLNEKIFGEGFRPGVQQHAEDDPAWEDLWKASVANPTKPSDAETPK